MEKTFLNKKCCQRLGKKIVIGRKEERQRSIDREIVKKEEKNKEREKRQRKGKEKTIVF